MTVARKPKILIIVGPTASGKSSLGIEIALRFSGEIISADSRQLFTGLDIGSGKVTHEEMRGIPHHLLSFADPRNRYTASNFEQDARTAITETLGRQHVPIIVGGTGFYIDALMKRRIPAAVAPNPAFRKTLEGKTVEELFSMVEAKDPARAKTIESKNSVRLIRALEIIESLGHVPKTPTVEAPYEALWLGIQPDLSELVQKIHVRLQARFEQGMIDEVRTLHAQGVTWERLEELGLEYRHIALFLQHKVSRETMATELERDIVRYAKRQLTYFKKNPAIQWFKRADDPALSERVATFLKPD